MEEEQRRELVVEASEEDCPAREVALVRPMVSIVDEQRAAVRRV